MARFTVFRNLPTEIQDAIWLLSLPDPQPEVCMLWPLFIRPSEDTELVLPLMVDTAWPSVIHVCQSARAYILRSGALRLRQSRLAGIAVPCREFDPAIDTFYRGEYQCYFVDQHLLEPEYTALVRSLRHIAVQLPASYPASTPADLIRVGAVNLRTLAIVLPDSTGTYSLKPFAPPARRCQLRGLSEDVLQNTMLHGVPFLEEAENGEQSLTNFIKNYRVRMESYVRRFNVTGDEGTAWNTNDECFSGIEIKAQTFVEYTTGDWIEICSHRMLGEDGEAPQVPYIPKEDRRSPADYRVLDDDCGRFGPGISYLDMEPPPDYGM